jgi:glycogen debranching enzyme
VVEGRTFLYSDNAGDVPRGSIGGLVHADTRLVNRWLLTVGGERLLVLRSGVVEPYSAEFLLTNDQLPALPANSVGVRRRRLIGDSVRERVELHSFAHEPIRLELRLGAGTDFADALEIKERVRRRHIERDHAPDGSGLTFRYHNGGYAAQTVIQAYPPADQVEGDDLVWTVSLPPGGQWRCDLDIQLARDPWEVSPGRRRFGDMPYGAPDDPVSVWRAGAPQLDSDSHRLNQVYRVAKQDLSALRISLRGRQEPLTLPAAGLPWYMTLFGRDTLITAYQSLSCGPLLARGALLVLALLQGTVCDNFNDEEPGRIPHELRFGELTQLGVLPYRPYYGTADATPLWLILLSEYWRWTGDDDLVRNLAEPAWAALTWIDRYGDRDGDGYVEYQTRSSQGLGNQSWRDSWDGVQFADGTLPRLPIATCEVQGYVYDAKLRLAELAAGPLADPALARRLRDSARSLRQRFNEDFWLANRGGYYAIGLDGDKRPIDSLTSNIGHLLWSGIVPAERAPLLARQLMSESMFSGWGVRTLSTMDSGYNPIGYHLGTVWPHDNSIIAAGLARYGLRDEANRIVLAQLEAAGHSGDRLPEVFSGYPRDFASFPVPYPTACSPQAWAAGAPLLFVRTMLGLDVRHGRITLDPRIPDQIGRITIRRLEALGDCWHIEGRGTAGELRLVAE